MRWLLYRLRCCRGTNKGTASITFIPPTTENPNGLAKILVLMKTKQEVSVRLIHDTNNFIHRKYTNYRVEPNTIFITTPFSIHMKPLYIEVRTKHGRLYSSQII